MGHWSIHIEGSGIHDNGAEYDIDTLLREFVNHLAIKGQCAFSATLTVGSTRELLPSDTGRIESPCAYRTRVYRMSWPGESS